mgnify:CR=1 FL=1
MAFCTFGDPDCDVTDGHRPTHCRSSTLEATKRALSYYMPHRTAPWCNNQGNPTHSAPVNDIIKEVKKFEVRGEGSPSKAKRAVRPNKFSHAIRLLRSLPSFDCKYKHPMVCLWQHYLIGRLDDAAHFEVKDPAGHPNFDFALRTNVRWSKNVMEERQCPPQVSSCICPLCLSLCCFDIFLTLSFCQIMLGARDSSMCTFLNFGIYLEEHLRRFPGVKYLFTEDLDDGAPERLKSNHSQPAHRLVSSCR